MKLFDTDKHFTFAFGTKEWEIVKYRVLSDFKSCFALAHRTQEPFKRLFLYSVFSLLVFDRHGRPPPTGHKQR